MRKAIITETNENVLLHDNGTWEYIEKKDLINNLDFSRDELISKTVDKMTNRISIHVKELIPIFNQNTEEGISFYAGNQLNANHLFLSFYAYGAGNCIDEDNEIIVLFRDGSKFTLRQSGDFNCDNSFTLLLTKDQYKREIDLLSSIEIETMRIYTTDSYVEQDLTPEQSKKIQKSIFFILNYD